MAPGCPDRRAADAAPGPEKTPGLGGRTGFSINIKNAAAFSGGRAVLSGLCLFNHAGNFVGKIVFPLLQALALLKADKGNDLDVAA